MAKLLIICDNQRQAENLFYRARSCYKRIGYNVSCDAMHGLIHDLNSEDMIRFTTKHSVMSGHVDDDYHGVHISGKNFDSVLDVFERNINERDKSDAAN